MPPESADLDSGETLFGRFGSVTMRTHPSA